MKRIFLNTLNILNNKERRRLTVLIVFSVFISITDIASLALLVLLISFYTQGAGHFSIASNFQWFFNNDSLVPISVFLVLFMLKSLLGYLIVAAQYRYVSRVASRISGHELSNCLEGGYSDYVTVDSSVYIRKTLHHPIDFCLYVLIGFQQIITEGILSFLTVVVVLIFNARLFLLLGLILLPPIVLLAYFTKRKLREARANANISSEKSLQYLQEALSGYVESNIYNKNQFFLDRFSLYQQKMINYLADIQTTQSAPSRLVEVFAVLGLFILVLANKFSGNSGSVEIIDICALMAAAYKIIPGIVRISNITGQIKTHEYAVNDLIQNKYVKKEAISTPLATIDSIMYRNVSFNHQQHIILNGFDFEIGKGDFIGITGASGSGKTTFIHLLLGFLSQKGGSIAFNGIITTPYERQHYWQHIAYTQQRPFLIHDTIISNIILDDEERNEKRLTEIIQAVGLNGLIDQYPEGLHKIITENGKNISGGQRQRITIARALYKNADLTILDEPFSELDAQSEQHILAHLKRQSENGKMIIMITHKTGNMLYCNKTYHIGRDLDSIILKDSHQENLIANFK